MGSLEAMMKGVEKTLDNHVANSAASRERLHSKIEAVDTKVDRVEDMQHAMEYRLARVEGTLKEWEPDMREFNQWRERAKGAGWLGRSLWIAGTFLLGVAYWLWTHLSAMFFTK